MAELLRLSGISKAFGGVAANEDIGFSLDAGEVLGLLGENGAGKTTLMNILFGHVVPDRGGVSVAGVPLPPGRPGAALAAGIGMVHQHFALAGNLSVLDNVLLGTRPLWSPRLDRQAGLARLRQLSAEYGLAVDPRARVADLSVGERQRVEILKALWREARVLILDEPTAVLTPQEAEALFATLRRAVAQGLAVILISHRLSEVMAVADRVVVLRRGRKVAEMAVRDTTREGLAKAMLGAELPLTRVQPPIRGPVRLELRDVDAAGQPGLRGANLVLQAGVITGLAGVSGNGQRCLAELLSGLRAPRAGLLRVEGDRPAEWNPRAAQRLGIGRIPEDRMSEGAVGDMDVAGNAILEDADRPPMSWRGWLRPGQARARARGLIERYDIRGATAATPARLLSGGNLQKLILGRVLEAHPGIILANQPGRGLDVGAMGFVHARLLAARARGAAILLISEDLDEVLAMADDLVVIHAGRLTRAHPRGSLDRATLGLMMAGQEAGDAA